VIIAQLIKKFSSFYGSRRFITVFTRDRHWILTLARWIQSTSSQPVWLLSVLILPFSCRDIPNGFRSVSYIPSRYMSRSHHLLWFVHYNDTGWLRNHAAHIKIFIDGSNSIQFDWINKHTVSLWLHKSPRRSRHVVTCSRQSVSCLSNSQCNDVFFTSATNGCSLSNTTWHLVLT
jgi:hypothetical protein